MNVNKCESKLLTKAVSRSSNWSVSFLSSSFSSLPYHINSMVSSRFDAYLDFRRRRFSWRLKSMFQPVSWYLQWKCQANATLHLEIGLSGRQTLPSSVRFVSSVFRFPPCTAKLLQLLHCALVLLLKRFHLVVTLHNRRPLRQDAAVRETHNWWLQIVACRFQFSSKGQYLELQFWRLHGRESVYSYDGLLFL